MKKDRKGVSLSKNIDKQSGFANKKNKSALYNLCEPSV